MVRENRAGAMNVDADVGVNAVADVRLFALSNQSFG